MRSISRRDILKIAGAMTGTAMTPLLVPRFAWGSEAFPEPDKMRPVTSSNLATDYLDTLRTNGFPATPADRLYALTCETRSDIPLNTGSKTLSYEANSFVDQSVTAPSNPGPVGPTMTFVRGKSTGVYLQNELTGCGQDYFIPHMEPKSHYTPHAFTVTNLHTHGLHVSPKAPEDDVLILVGSSNVKDPDDGKIYEGKFSYRYDLPDTHPVGTFWYHPHKHGSVSTQIATGMAGALIVRSDKDDKDFDQLLAERCGITEADERILVFTTSNYMTESGRPDNAVFDPLLYATSNKVSPGCPVTAKTQDETVMLVNGQYQPTLTMKKGEMLRFRIINATVGQVIIPKFKTVSLANPSGLGTAPQTPDVYAVAVDGIALTLPFDPSTSEVNAPYYAIDYDVTKDMPSKYLTTGELINVAAGQRLDLVVHATEAGHFTLWGADTDEAPTVVSPNSSGKTPGNVFIGPLFNVRVIDEPRTDQTLPTLALFQQQSIQRPPSGIAPRQDIVEQLKHTGFREMAFSDPVDNEPYFTINGKYFEEGNPPGAQVQLKLDNIDWWYNYSKAGAHIFHIHINSFQLAARCPTVNGIPNLLEAVTYEMPIWRDTLYFDSHPPSGVAQKDGTGVISVSKQVDFTGEFVLHCHNVFHEDAGMMFTVSIEA
ncbi:multicopper oxidase domain-containing protein [Nisaea acidiphila]|uniref:Multicopper oxidase domain-containing protein n=1 Tax=Nisaea acidiphila TaxID=1862145 RepID=A0A9J7ANJ6_9PROT|nr:multicopper oxidase domain-containing protein [Nisaea acidiphila]UUX48514.1 multicopper oxidase domain-containing protein [Nisaea acidiphila]